MPPPTARQGERNQACIGLVSKTLDSSEKLQSRAKGGPAAEEDQQLTLEKPCALGYLSCLKNDRF
jgi:hypothetical protein